MVAILSHAMITYNHLRIKCSDAQTQIHNKNYNKAQVRAFSQKNLNIYIFYKKIGI